MKTKKNRKKFTRKYIKEECEKNSGWRKCRARVYMYVWNSWTVRDEYREIYSNEWNNNTAAVEAATFEMVKNDIFAGDCGDILSF